MRRKNEIKLKKSAILLSVLMLLFVFSGSAFAIDCSRGPSASTPIRTSIYYQNTWSNTDANWDFRNVGIPSNAVVTGVVLSWSTSTYGYSGMHIWLAQEDGTGAEILYNNLMNHTFDGQPAAQLWASRFYVEQWSKPGTALYVTPKLTVYYSY